MQISISTGDCRIAIARCIEAQKEKAASDREAVEAASFKALHDGAVHNGLHVDAAREKEMREMVTRDVAHMMSKHPSVETLNTLLNYSFMLDHHDASVVTINEMDFELLKAYLPK